MSAGDVDEAKMEADIQACKELHDWQVRWEEKANGAGLVGCLLTSAAFITWREQRSLDDAQAILKDAWTELESLLPARQGIS